MLDLAASRLHLVAGPSVRLRDELVATLGATWTGPCKRLSDPDDVPRLLLDLDTPSLFDPPSLVIVRASAAWLRRHRQVLAPLAGTPISAGLLLVSAAEVDRRDELAKALAKAGALHLAEGPGDKEAVEWLAARLIAHPQGAERPREVAAALVEHLGADVDALLSAVDLVAVFCDGGPLHAAAVDLLVGGSAAQPVWEFTGAFLDGDAPRAIGLLHAGGERPEAALGALFSELRKELACCDSSDDAEASAWAGMRRSGNLYHARRRARSVGRPTLLRLLHGALLAQRQLRQTGYQDELVLETLVLHAQRLVRSRAR